jgi:hypothetical protein
MLKIPPKCAFGVTEYGGSCLDKLTIDGIKNYLQNIHGVRVENKPAVIIEQAKQVTECKTEKCIVRRPDVQKHIPKNASKRLPIDGPAESTQWLNNDNIDGNLARLDNCIDHFKHITFQMSDFDEQKSELHRVNLATEYSKGVRTLACVLNTDRTGRPGQHWFCLFVDMRSAADDNVHPAAIRSSSSGNNGNMFTIEYFNSAGDPPLPSVDKWMRKQEMFLENSGRKANCIEVCNVAIQHGDTECGVYCLLYIYNRLQGTSWRVFRDPATAPDDEYVQSLRKNFFQEAK